MKTWFDKVAERVGHSSFAPAFKNILIEAINQEDLTANGSETLIEMFPIEANRSRVDKSLVEDVTLALMIRDGAVEVIEWDEYGAPSKMRISTARPGPLSTKPQP
jgi:hypothetical protein